ncbi:dihydroneopterin aldolase [Cohnella sp. CIP 111063]|jgi:dihydroneopterin aldolase|uniref:dihydroneopterin aldolase n=1 Tax=unclassified Cohnella TaxID=2636738 RepID=UPI000B8C1FE6|nr:MULTISPECIES: dihydroneopterin aldolase [unclassified Cohnella]OXS54643.1 dihydroneopterin aldolase [Cohnella sp. CIP 111063]PRX64468.1 dihydroneopterin aldolase [Cohnella sp. SGD-V74]
MDRMQLKRMVFYGYHGVYPEENKLGQKYCVDLDLRLDLARAALSDDVEDTVNYAEIHALVKRIVEGPPVKLIETLAANIASAVLGTYTSIHKATVSVTKPNPPFDITFDGVTVELSRRRGPDGSIVPAED